MWDVAQRRSAGFDKDIKKCPPMGPMGPMGPKGKGGQRECEGSRTPAAEGDGGEGSETPVTEGGVAFVFSFLARTSFQARSVRKFHEESVA